MQVHGLKQQLKQQWSQLRQQQQRWTWLYLKAAGYPENK